MMAKKIKRDYDCSDAELYAIAMIAWKSFNEHLNDFSGYKNIYTAGFYTDRMAELEAAAALPDLQGRNGVVEIARIALKGKASEGRALWQRLRSYIEGAYDEEQHEILLESAGWKYYRKASQQNWEVLLALINSGVQFLNNHGGDPELNGLMPPAFVNEMAVMDDDLRLLYEDFKDKQQGFKQHTEQKKMANNGVYEQLIRMMKDGQQLYRGNAALREQFYFSKVKRLVTPERRSVKRRAGNVMEG